MIMSNAIIKCWLARDKSGSLYMFSYKPHRTDGIFVPYTTDNQFLVVDNIFPELTWENSPVEVELTIKPVL